MTNLQRLVSIAKSFNVVFPLLCRGAHSPKLKKKEVVLGLHSAILYLWPDFKLCGDATKACMASCLVSTSGRATWDLAIPRARKNRSRFFHSLPITFLVQIEREIRNLVIRASKLGLVPALRPNGGSDTNAFDYLHAMFPSVQFWDYTKSVERMRLYLRGQFAPNYHLTFSRSETNDQDSLDVLSSGGNVAVVFRNKDIPVAWFGYPVINGDAYDYRWLDPSNVVVGLSAKGSIAKSDSSGLVVG